MPHELFLTTRQTTKIRNAFSNNMSKDIRLSKAQISKIIQLGGSFGFQLDNLVKKVLPDLATPLAIDNLPQIVSFESSNEDMNYINKITKIIRRFSCIN